jgi:predicted kinase
MPKCYQLVGVPGSGKSTWHSEQEWMQGFAYISTDRYVEEYAKNMGKTYSEVFNEVMPKCVEYMTGDVVNAREAGQDIVWDQTSTSLASRARKFAMLPDYEHIAVVFATPAPEELSRRLTSRYDSGKIIPEHVMCSMIDNWDEPELDEGFREIWRVQCQQYF